jgi:hypothetical protein
MDATAIKRDPRAEAILESLKNGGSIVAACKAASVDPSTFWRWRKADTVLDEDARQAIQSRIMVVEDALYKSALGGNVTAQMFFLMNRDPDTWKDKRAIFNSNTNIVKVTVNPVKGYKDEELDAIIGRAIKR